VITVTPEGPHAVGSTVTLSSSASSARAGGTIISVQWVLTSFPADATPRITQTPTTELVGDVAGTFSLELIVVDDAGASTTCQVDVAFE
jgi:hypothetical protein